jgi:methionine salvage enolase-phosphatase E1
VIFPLAIKDVPGQFVKKTLFPFHTKKIPSRFRRARSQRQPANGMFDLTSAVTIVDDAFAITTELND